MVAGSHFSELSFGEWLRRRRGALDLTQAELAKQINCAVVTLRKFEAEERRPSLEMAQQIAVALQIPDEMRAEFVRFARGEIRAGERLNLLNDLVNGSSVENQPVVDTFKPGPMLPIPPYAIIGREDLIAHASEIMANPHVRVFTLTGPPGVGKTRLALELAHRLKDKFAHGAVFVELAPVQDAALVPAALAEALAIEGSPTADFTATLFAALRDKHMLLVLDNFEHVIDAAGFVADLVSRFGKLVCLITSRERLRIRAERVLRVDVLAVPKAATMTMDGVQASPAAQLFIARAREANANLILTDKDAPAIAELCAQLEGLPLALELLAARADLFSPAQLLDDLRYGLNALEEGPRDLPERHRGLRAAIEWSLRLLDVAQRKLFAELAVFVGGFAGPAVQAILNSELADLGALAQVNLIQVQPGGRYAMLEPIRQYAEEMLIASGGAEDVRQSHAQFFAMMTHHAYVALLGPDAGIWMKRLETDHANILAALQWALHAHNAEIAITIGQGMFRFWHRRGLWREALGWLEPALQMNGAIHVPLDLRIKTGRAAGYMAQSLGQYERAEIHFMASQNLAYELEDDEQVAAACVALGILRKEQGRFDESLAYFDQAIELEPEHALKFPWQSKADLLLRLDRLDEAAALYEQAMALNRRIGDEEGLAHTLRGLGEIAWRRGDATTAESCIQENEAIAHKLHHAIGLALAQKHFGNIAAVRRQWNEAAKYYAEALSQMSQMGDLRGLCEVLAACAHLAVTTQQFEVAVQWLGMAETGFRSLNAKLTQPETKRMEFSRTECVERLAPDVFAQATAHGTQLWIKGDITQVIGVLVGGRWCT